MDTTLEREHTNWLQHTYRNLDSDPMSELEFFDINDIEISNPYEQEDV